MKPSAKENRHPLTVWLEMDRIQEFRMIAIATGKTQQELLVEMLDWLKGKYGTPTLRKEPIV